MANSNIRFKIRGGMRLGEGAPARHCKILFLLFITGRAPPARHSKILFLLFITNILCKGIYFIIPLSQNYDKKNNLKNII